MSGDGHERRVDTTRRKRSHSPGRERGSARREKQSKKRKTSPERDEHAHSSSKSAKARTDQTLGNYTELDNPFNDINLGQEFRWQKKIDRERKRGISPSQSRRMEASRRQEARQELEILNRRRIEREADQELREQESARTSRLAETAQMAEWLEKEGVFQLEQERSRAAIRLKERRAKAIDFLALNLKYSDASPGSDHGWQNVDDEGIEIDLDEPYDILQNLSPEQTMELRDDIQRYLALEQNPVYIDFWTNMVIVVGHRLEQLKRNKSMLPKDAMEANAAVEAEIFTLLQGKSLDDLNQLQRQIQAKLRGNEPVDNDYWESLMKNVIVFKAKAKLKATHEVIVRNRLEQLRRRQRDQAVDARKALFADFSPSESNAVSVESSQEVQMDRGQISYIKFMSPVPVEHANLSAEERQLPIGNWEDDKKDLIRRRRAVADARFITRGVDSSQATTSIETPSSTDAASDALWQAEAEKNLEEEEELFNIEESITKPSYAWEDKYRPRKPRYFNRVHTGYEWNKYNQTHYDTDNPPPKVVQGYKFNIFYPDLIDTAKAPSYKIIRDSDNSDTVLLHFTAGPPYEDIAFRIVDREWEYSHKRGFRSSFDRGCLSLWFNFRRNFYRK